MNRRNFLTKLGIGAAACAVVPLTTIETGLNNGKFYDGGKVDSAMIDECGKTDSSTKEDYNVRIAQIVYKHSIGAV